MIHFSWRDRHAAAFLSSQPIQARRSLPLRPSSICVRHFSGTHIAQPVGNSPTRCILSLPPVAVPSAASALSAASKAASPFAIWTTLLTAATLGMISQKYQWGRALTPPLVATLFTLILSNFQLMPATHPIYTAVTSFIVPLSVPLILLGADLRRVFAQTGRLLPVFITGAIATCVGTVTAWYIVPIKSIGSGAWKIAAALTARHIGGAVNYVAVADATNAPPEIVTAALTADNVVVALYFVVLLMLARNVLQPSVSSDSSDNTGSADDDSDKSLVPSDSSRETGSTNDDSDKATVSSNSSNEAGSTDDDSDSEESGGPISVQDAGVALALSAALCTVSAFISTLLPLQLGVVPIVTALIVAIATAFPRQLLPYRKAASALGIFFLQIFFAAAGAGGSLFSVLRRAPVLLVFSIVQIFVHLMFLLIAERLFRFHRANVLLASNANVS